MTTALSNGLRRVAARLAPDDPPDGELLARFLDHRDEAAFAALVRRHAAMVFGTCRRVLANTADADDAFQASFVVLARRAAGFTGRANVGNFLYGVAYHTALKAKAMAAKRRLREAKAERPPAPASDAELLRALDEELAGLPEKYRGPVVLCELEGQSRRDAAAALGVPEGTVSSRLATAHRMLQKRLQARGFAVAGLTALLADRTAAASPGLAAAAVQAALTGPAGGVIPLVAEVSRMLFLSKLKLGSAVVVSLSLMVLGGGLIPGPAGTGTAHGEEKPKAADAPTVEALVAQLGDPSFARREAAEKSLRAVGTKAIPALKAGLQSESLEVKERSEKLIARIHKEALQRFVDKKDDRPSPVWERFKAITGDSPEGRKLYAELMADYAQADRLEQADADAAKTRTLYTEEMGRVKAAWAAAHKVFLGQPASPESGRAIRKRSLEVVKRDDVLRCLFLGARPLPPGTADTDHDAILQHGHFIDLANGGEKDAFRKLYVAWLDRRTNPTALRHGLEAALYGGIPEAVPVARRMVADSKQLPTVVGTAVVVIGNHGELVDLRLLETLRTDERVYSEYRTIRKETLTSQLRDVAAAMSMQLRKEDFTKYGFDDLQMIAYWVGPDPAPYKGVNYFEKPADRDAALAKAWAWLDAQPRPGEPAWMPAFRTAYQLKPGEYVKRVSPPFSDSRTDFLKQFDAGGPEAFKDRVYSYRTDGTKIEIGGMTHNLNGKVPAESTLASVLSWGVLLQEVESPVELRTLPITGEFVVRTGAKPEDFVPGVEKILRNELKLPIRLKVETLERDVIVAKGKYASKPLSDRKPNVVDLYAVERASAGEEAGGGSGTFTEFLETTGGYLSTRVVNEVEKPPPQKLVWHFHNSTRVLNGPDPNQDLDGVLKKVSEQTGLTFEKAKRKARVISIVEDKK